LTAALLSVAGHRVDPGVETTRQPSGVWPLDVVAASVVGVAAVAVDREFSGAVHVPLGLELAAQTERRGVPTSTE